MNEPKQDAGAISRILSQFERGTAVPDDVLREHVRSACSRALPCVVPCRPHSRRMAVAAGGPSLEDTWPELSGVVCAVNGSLSCLLERGVKPWAAGAMDARAHMADIIEARPGIVYFLASTCHPSLFDKIIKAGCTVFLWHPSGTQATDGLTRIGGGSTMGLRWPALGHFMGFRSFDMHGLDSSFRGGRTHAYPDYRDGRESLELMGYRTSINFIEQIKDWVEMNAAYAGYPPEDRVAFRLFGDGLLQTYWRELCSRSAA